MVHSGIDEFPNASEADLRLAMPILCASSACPCWPHAELDLGAAEISRSPHLPRLSCVAPTRLGRRRHRLLITLCRETGCRVHVVHLSSASAVPLLRAARAEGLPISVETCPHYLCLDAESIPDGCHPHYSGVLRRSASARTASGSGKLCSKA